MGKVIATGKTVKEAVESALQELGTTEDKVYVKVIEQPIRRLFGLMGKKDAVVEVELISEPVNPTKEFININHVESIEEAKKLLYEVFKTMELTVRIEELSTREHVMFNLVGRDLGILIGRRGQTLDSLQYIVNIVANKRNRDSRVRIVLDAENYRSRRKVTLERLAIKLADSVIRTGKEVVLEPMTPLERKIIHTKLQDHPKVDTFSIDEEPNRKVVITAK